MKKVIRIIFHLILIILGLNAIVFQFVNFIFGTANKSISATPNNYFEDVIPHLFTIVICLWFIVYQIKSLIVRRTTQQDMFYVFVVQTSAERLIESRWSENDQRDFVFHLFCLSNTFLASSAQNQKNIAAKRQKERGQEFLRLCRKEKNKLPLRGKKGGEENFSSKVSV